MSNTPQISLEQASVDYAKLLATEGENFGDQLHLKVQSADIGEVVLHDYFNCSHVGFSREKHFGDNRREFYKEGFDPILAVEVEGAGNALLFRPSHVSLRNGLGRVVLGIDSPGSLAVDPHSSTMTYKYRGTDRKEVEVEDIATHPLLLKVHDALLG